MCDEREDERGAPERLVVLCWTHLVGVSDTSACVSDTGGSVVETGGGVLVPRI